MLVALTGATGFVGRRTVRALLGGPAQVRALTRSAEGSADLGQNVETRIVGSIDSETDWSDCLHGVDAVIHLASRVHVLDDRAANPLAEYREVNVAGTLRFARAAAEAGVRRFLFVSSIKVNGEETTDTPFSEASEPDPQDPYGVSKWEAELGLHEVAAATGMEVVVLRPPLVYGPGVRANFLRLLNGVGRGVPFPVGAIRNRRSLIFVGNLADAIVRTLNHPRAASETYLVSDGEPVSTAELVRSIGRAMGRNPRIVSLPPSLMRFGGLLTGRQAVMHRLSSSLEVDSRKIRESLEWSPPFSMEQGIEETAVWWREAGGR